MSWPVFIGLWIAWLAMVAGLPKPMGTAALAATALGSLAAGTVWTPYQRLAAMSACLLMVFKLVAWRRHGQLTAGTAFFLFAWPGIDPAPFSKPIHWTRENGRRFGFGMIRFLFGIAVLGGVSLFIELIDARIVSWIAVFALLTAIHLGLSDMLTEIAHAFGWKVKPLFDAPWRSTSLSDFWSRRWNRPFVELNRLFFMPWLTSKLGLRGAIFAAFVISGLLHELAISFPAGSGWGGPLAYFLIQGALVFGERKLGLKGSTWASLAVLAPLPLLFHRAFLLKIIYPLPVTIHAMLVRIDGMDALGWLALILGLSHFLVLGASFQVPKQLRWKQELAALGPFNRKLMWTYGIFIVLTIVTWGALTLILRQDLVQGTRAGQALAAVILIFWTSRLIVDATYFESDDWPKGPFMGIGHTMLNCLFVFLCLGYGTLLAWRWFT